MNENVEFMAPSLPACDPADVVESAVISRLAENWSRRATVKRKEPDLDELFDVSKSDFPEAMIPFRDHDLYRNLEQDQKDRINSWGWIAYNKNVMDIEQYVVNPGFSLLAQDAFGTGLGDTLTAAVLQATVDEQYHTLMHLNASALTRRRRGWRMPDRSLPYSLTVRRHQAVAAAMDSPWERALTILAFTTVAETSISAYLGLMSENIAIQPVNRATVALHRRDEYCHSAITEELAKIVYERLSADDRRVFVAGLMEGVDAFTVNDFETWSDILRIENVRGAETIIRDTELDQSRQRLLQDCSAIRRLCSEMGVADDVRFEN